MTNLVQVEKRNGRWCRADTGAPLTCDELHRAYYLGAVLSQINEHNTEGARLLNRLSHTTEEAIDDLKDDLAAQSEAEAQIHAINAELRNLDKPKPSAAERAQQRWKANERAPR